MLGDVSLKQLKDAVGFAPRDAVSLYVAQGDQKFQQLLLDASLAEYEMAENSLKEFTEESYIDQLDVIEKRYVLDALKAFFNLSF